MKLAIEITNTSEALNYSKMLRVYAEIKIIESSPELKLGHYNTLRMLNSLYPQAELWNSGGGCMVLSMKLLDVDLSPVWLHASDEVLCMYSIVVEAGSEYLDRYKRADNELSYIGEDETSLVLTLSLLEND